MYDFQKANMFKRISAALFDAILLITAAIGFALVLSSALGYDAHIDKLQGHYDAYEERYGIDFDITAEEYRGLDDTVKQKYLDADEAFGEDAEVNKTYGTLFNLTLIIVTFGILLAYLMLEFAVPLLFKNGQTMGKKIFGIGVMRMDGVRVTPMLLFIRTVLGKYTIETMIPVLVAIMIYFNVMGIVGTAVILVLLIIQLVLIIATKAHTPIHDKLAFTVSVDIASQMIFDTPEALLEYKQRVHAENVNQTAS